jgi:maltose O-acetyltransferase
MAMIQKIVLTYRSVLRDIRLKLFIKEGLRIGNGCFVSSGSFIDPSFLHLIEIGNNVTITENVKILAHDSSTKIYLGVSRVGKVKIGDNVFIGMGSIILPNVNIGSNSIIGAGSVVTKDIPERVVAAGNPAKVLYSIDIFLCRHKEQLRNSPFFGEKYTIENNIKNQKKDEMNRMLEATQGYIL